MSRAAREERERDGEQHRRAKEVHRDSLRQTLTTAPPTGPAVDEARSMCSSPRPVSQSPVSPPVPLGPRLEAVLELGYRARRPVLLEGPTGIGKSEIVRHVAERLGISTIVLDLSLLEPPDLVGLPVITDGRTAYAVPTSLPKDGAGILMLEELNRAERYIQQPALQLLTARRLHEYELPPGWVCFAAINPPSGDYHVTTLDRALRARFLEVSVRDDRAAWLAWAETRGVHPGVIARARAHERIFDDVSPRPWTFVSQVLGALTPSEVDDTTLLRDALGGYLPPVWVEALLASRGAWSARLPFDVLALLSRYDTDAALPREVRGFRDRGETDRLDEVVKRLAAILSGPEAGVLAGKKLLTLGSFEAFVADLPGDHRERLEEALGHNATACAMVDVTASDLLHGFVSSGAQRKLAAWSAAAKPHRVGLAVTAVRSYLEQQGNAIELKKSNTVRTNLGLLLSSIDERWAMPLVTTMKRLGITPIRPQ